MLLCPERQVLWQLISCFFSGAGKRSGCRDKIILHIGWLCWLVQLLYKPKGNTAKNSGWQLMLDKGRFIWIQRSAVSSNGSRIDKYSIKLRDNFFLSSIIKKNMNRQNSPLPSQRSKNIRTHRKPKRKQIKLKQNNFVLDCVNEEKSKLKSYNSVGDKFLNYFVIRVHPNCGKLTPLPYSQPVDHIEREEKTNHQRFQEMLQRQKEKLATSLSQSTSQPCIRQPEHAKTATHSSTLVQEINSSIKYKVRQKTIQQETGSVLEEIDY